jgi:hypothetical protein
MSPAPTSSPQVKHEHRARVTSQSPDCPEIANEPPRLRRKLNTHAAATYSGLARSTLEKLRVFGGGPDYIKIGRRVLYDMTDLEQWLGSHRRRSTSDTGNTSLSANKTQSTERNQHG